MAVNVSINGKSWGDLMLDVSDTRNQVEVYQKTNEGKFSTFEESLGGDIGISKEGKQPFIGSSSAFSLESYLN